MKKIIGIVAIAVTVLGVTSFASAEEVAAAKTDQNTDFLKMRVANNPKLTDAEKTDLVNFFEAQYPGNASFREVRYQGAMARFQTVANDPNLTMDQRKDMIRQFAVEEKDSVEAFRESERAESKADLQRMRDEARSEVRTDRTK